jgi:thiazole synthase ThiGH ThiG subunit
MSDTHPEVAIRYRDLMMRKTGQQRLLMGFSKYDTAKQIVRNAIRNDRPEITDVEMKKEISLRFHGKEFGPLDRKKFLSALAAK